MPTRMSAMIRTLTIFVFGLVVLAPSATKISRYTISFGKSLSAKTSAKSTEPIYLIVSSIWQGDHIRAHNVAAISQFRRSYGSLPLTHFVSPAYFLREDKNVANYKTMIESVNHLEDKVGMIVHPWQSLTSKSGVLFRKGPTFWGDHLDQVQCASDCGKEVPLAVYPKSDINKLIAVGRRTLEDQGFKKLESFMAGGWMATPHVLSAAAANDFKYDYSSVSQHLIRDKLQHYPLYAWVGEIWPGVTPHTQPKKVNTDYGDLIEIGNSAAMIDLLSTQQITDLFDTYLAKKRANPHESLTFHIAFHQETAMKYLPRLEAALQHIFSISEAQQVNIKPVALPVGKLPAKP